ncbi:hypothetical protein T09_7334, partial [Trichinella sp. T9]
MWVTIGPRADDSMIRKHSPGWTPCIMCGADVLHGPEHVWNYLPDQEAESSEGQSTLLCQTVGLVSRGYTHNILGTSSIHLFHSLSFGMSKPSTYVSVDLGGAQSDPSSVNQHICKVDTGCCDHQPRSSVNLFGKS